MSSKHKSQEPRNSTSPALHHIFMMFGGLLTLLGILLPARARFVASGIPVVVSVILVVVGIILLYIGLYLWAAKKVGISAGALLKKNLKVVGIGMLAGTLVVGIPLICIFSNSGSSSSSGSNSKIAECKVCEREFEAGDRAGNYKRIARTGMCNNCYKNYQWGEEYID